MILKLTIQFGEEILIP